MINAPAGSVVLQGAAIPARSKSRDLAEIAIGYGLILLVIWTPRPLQQYLWLLAAAVIATMIGLSFEGTRALGLGSRNFLRSAWVVGVAVLVSAITVLVAERMDTLRTPGGAVAIVENFWSYAIWSGVQQFLLQCFFLSRIVRLIPNPQTAAFTAAGLFALAHLPNPVLVLLTVVWGSLACLVYLRYRNLYPLAIAHAILGITIAVSVPGHLDHNMRVGLGYLRYHKDPSRPRLHRSHRDQIASTDAWVTAEAATRRSVLQARP
jgi:membrane protease YdiL (CAAX protease family)